MNKPESKGKPEPPAAFDGASCSALDHGDFKAGWMAAMKSIWDRLPMPAYGSDPMTAREVEKLLAYVRSHLPNRDVGQTHSPKAKPEGHDGYGDSVSES